jgi:FkbH-like protein
VTQTLHDATRQQEFTELHVTEAPAVYGPRIFKCIVWDLDETVWNGVLADVGPLGVRVRREAVEAIETIDCRGILHSIASQSHFDKAMSVLRGNGLEDYFVFPQINARPKAESIRRIAHRLRIPIDEMAFVDDQASERAEVQSTLPGITVIDAADCIRIPDRPECMIPRTEATEHLRHAVREWQRIAGHPVARSGDCEGRGRSRAHRVKTVDAEPEFDPSV